MQKTRELSSEPMTNDDAKPAEGVGPRIEGYNGPFIMIRLPTLGSLDKLYGHALAFEIQRQIGGLVEQHLGAHTLFWLSDRYGVQVHKPMDVPSLQLRLQDLSHDLSRGLTLTLDGHQTQIQWVNHPSLGVVTACQGLNLAERIAMANEALNHLGSLMHKVQPPLNISYHDSQSSTHHDANTGGTVEPSEWRKEKALRIGLQEQALELEFKPAKDALTDGLAGFRVKFQPLIRYDDMEVRLNHSEILRLGGKIGLGPEINLILIRNALNQCRIWNMLVPGNDATITAPMDIDTLVQNQERIYELLMQYNDVAGRLIMALEIGENSVAESFPAALNSCIADLHRKTGARFALTEFGLSKKNLRMAQELDVQVVYLAGQWPETATSHSFSDPILPNLIELLHSLRTEVVGTNISTQRQLDNLKGANIDRYEPSQKTSPALREDEALALLEAHQNTVASTVINARYRFRKAP